jgi:hypothetical protein
MRPDEAAAREFGTMEAVRGHLLLTNCLEDELTRPNIELALKADRLLWLDLEGTDDEVLTLLHEVFKIHPLAVEDVKEFHQRPKIEDYDDFVSIVVYGARGLGEPLTEVHCFYAERFLVSVHRDDVPAGEPGRVADGVPHLRHRHRGAGRHRPVRHVPAARLDGQEELTRRTGSAPGRAREKAPG